MFEQNGVSSTSQATESTISFDAPDLTECPDNCEQATRNFGYAHAHCAWDGAVVFAEGGGGDDGRGVGGYDGVPCYKCHDVMCHGCGDLIDGARYCRACSQELISEAQEKDLVEVNLAHAAEDIADSRKRMLRETDTGRLESLSLQLELLQSIVNKFRLDLDAKLIAHRNLPFVFGAAS